MPFLAPAFSAVAAFASTAIGSIIISVGATIAISLLQMALTPAPTPYKPEQRVGGVRLQVQMGDTGPLTFPVGYSATAGTRRYMNTWGQAGKVPNAYLVEIRQLADVPISGLNGIWINGQRCTILWGEAPTEMGYPVQEYRVNGTDYFWVKFHDGTQTAADPYVTSKFSAHPDYPWGSNAIGYDVPYVVTTARWDRNVWSGRSQIDLVFEPASAFFYDLRKDSTNGGSGSHRWDDPTTWEPSTNPPVILYNIIRGVYLNDEWLFGGRNIKPFQLPAASWIAAANECDLPIDLESGGTEPQYRCGMEIECDREPLQVIEELLRICNGYLCEIGGIFEIMVGTPSAAVYSFTDADILVSRGQRYTPFPGLKDTRNCINYTYPEPEEKWASKDGPARYYPEFEAEDGGRRLASGLSFVASPFNVQNQRLAHTLVHDDRRWRVHEFSLPPDAWVLTGTSVVNWTSERNGYVNKKFRVVRATGEPGMCQPVVLREIDPSDYDWSSDLELPNPTVTLVPVRPAPQTPTGFQVFPATFKDSDGTDRRPSILVMYDGNMADIQSVHVLVRLQSTGAYVFEGFIPFEPPYSYVLNAVLLPAETYEVAIRYVPISARETLFTEYQVVTTDNVKLVAGKDFDPFENVADFGTIGPGLDAWTAWVGASVREVIEAVQDVSNYASDQEQANLQTFHEVRTEMAASIGDVSASFEQTITVAIVPLQNQVVALADWVTELSAGDGSDVSTARFRMTTVSGPVGYSRIGAETRVDVADPGAWRGAAWYLDTPNDPLLPTRFVVRADQFIVVSSDDLDVQQPLVFESGELKLQVANIGLVRAGRLESANGNSFIDLNTGAFRFST